MSKIVYACLRVMPKNARSTVAIFMALLLALCSACSIRLIAQYDSVTDKSLTALQKSVDGMLLDIAANLGKPAAEYKNYLKTYQKIYVDLNVLKTRAEAMINNQLTVQELLLLRDALEKFEQAHKLGFKQSQELVLAQNAVDAIFRALLKLELAKK